MNNINLTVFESRTYSIPLSAIKEELNLNEHCAEYDIMYELFHCSKETIAKLCTKGAQIDGGIENVIIESTTFNF